MNITSIKIDGVSFTLTHIYSCKDEREFINSLINEIYQLDPLVVRRKKLKTVYQIAKKMAKAKEKNEGITNG